MSDGLVPTTIFDCLYRLRMRANYEDADLFLVSANDKDALRFNESLRKIAYNSLEQIELLIAKNLGKTQYDNFINQCAKDQSFLREAYAQKRWEFLSKIF